MTKIVHLHRGPVAWFFEVVFYIFNLIMAAVMISAVVRSGDILAAAETELAKGIAGFGAAMRVFILLFVWMAGDLILASLTLITRTPKVTIQEN
jgi:hypothetical protein